MKRLMHYLLVVVTMVMALNLAACSSWEKNAYKTLKAAATLYDETMELSHTYAVTGITDPAKRLIFVAKVQLLAEPVQTTLLAAVEAARTYSYAKATYLAAKEDSDDDAITLAGVDLTAAQEAFSEALANLDVQTFYNAVKSVIATFKEAAE